MKNKGKNGIWSWLVVLSVLLAGVGTLFLYTEAVGIFSGHREFGEWMFWTLTNKHWLFYTAMTVIGACVGWLGWWFLLGGKRSGKRWGFWGKKDDVQS